MEGLDLRQSYVRRHRLSVETRSKSHNGEREQTKRKLNGQFVDVTLRSSFSHRVLAILSVTARWLGKEDFTFIMNGTPFAVPLTEALLLSSKGCASVRSDVTCCSLSLDADDARAADFSEFLTFIHRCRVFHLDVESS
jgi:hypothetical protein